MMTRLEQAMIALHDYGTREGATAKSVMREMKKAGFTQAEILKATSVMSGK
jgi:hypothetical protein